MEEIPLIDFLEFDDVAEKTHPDKKFVPFWKLILRGNELVIRATVSDGKVGPQESDGLAPCQESRYHYCQAAKEFAYKHLGVPRDWFRVLV